MACSNYSSKKAIRQMRKSQERALQYQYWQEQSFQQRQADFQNWQSAQQWNRRMDLTRDAQQMEAPTLTTEQVRHVSNVIQEQYHAHGVNTVSVAISIGVIAHAATVGLSGLFEAIGNVVESHGLNKR